MIHFLSQLPALGKKRKKRVGRGPGSGRGAKSGRGTTRHQKAREGIPLHFEGGQAKVIKKFPLLRGKGKNKSKRAKPISIPLNRLNALSDNVTVDMSLLIKHGLLSQRDSKQRVKIVAKGELTKKLIIKLPISRKAGEMVKTAGGRIEQI